MNRHKLSEAPLGGGSLTGQKMYLTRIGGGGMMGDCPGNARGGVICAVTTQPQWCPVLMIRAPN